jgi:hypothetical protein
VLRSSQTRTRGNKKTPRAVSATRRPSKLARFHAFHYTIALTVRLSPRCLPAFMLSYCPPWNSVGSPEQVERGLQGGLSFRTFTLMKGLDYENAGGKNNWCACNRHVANFGSDRSLWRGLSPIPFSFPPSLAHPYSLPSPAVQNISE